MRRVLWQPLPLAAAAAAIEKAQLKNIVYFFGIAAFLLRQSIEAKFVSVPHLSFLLWHRNRGVPQ